MQDTQSDSNRAAQVAGDLINNTEIDMMMVASTPDTVKPTVDQCEANGVPPLVHRLPLADLLGLAFDTVAASGPTTSSSVEKTGWNVVVKCYDQLPTNKTVGYMLPNDADGNYYRTVFPGLFGEEWL